MSECTPEGQIARRAASLHEEGIRQYHALAVRELVLILHGIEHNIVQKLEDGPVDALLNARSTVLLHQSPDLLLSPLLGLW